MARKKKSTVQKTVKAAGNAVRASLVKGAVADAAVSKVAEDVKEATVLLA